MDVNRLIEITGVAAKLLYRLKDENDIIENYEESLVFPTKRQKRGIIKRVSEQELRLLFCKILFEQKIFFCIETPTIEKYRLSKSKDKDHQINIGVSARTDITLFKINNKKIEREWNIEFKEGTNFKGISKDIYKLLVEKQNGAMIHLVETHDKNTMKNIFDKYRYCLNRYMIYESNSEIKTYLFIFILMKTEEMITMSGNIKDVFGRLNSYL